MADYLKVYDVFDNNGAINLIRVGRDFDGGYIVPKLALEASDALISYGIRDDISFESDYSKFFLKPSYAFDCSIQGIKNYNPLVHFSSECVGNLTYVENNGVAFDKLKVTPFKQHLTNLNLNNKKIFIKMDIEGSEYDAMPEILGYVNDITGIAIEIHFRKDDLIQKALDLLKELEKNFVLVHIHGSNCVPSSTFTSSKIKGEVDRTIEFSYINKSLLSSYKISKDQVSPSKFDIAICPQFPVHPFEVLVSN